MAAAVRTSVIIDLGGIGDIVLIVFKNNRFEIEIITETAMNTKKVWQKPSAQETGTGLEVTSYLPAELDNDL